MSIAVVVNTAALGAKSGNVLSNGKVPYRKRERILRDILLPRLTANPFVDEVVITGEWREPDYGESWHYVPCASVKFDCTDALAQRQAGAETTKANLLVFLHDDHVPAEDFFATLANRYATRADWDVLVPERRTFREGREIVLNNGRHEYVMGHACVMRREVWKDCPWTDAPQVFTWDVGYTIQLRDKHHATIRWVTDLIVYDCETALGAEPWR